MIATINCSECGHDKGHTLEHVGHDTLAECTNCDHVNDVIEQTFKLQFTRTITHGPEYEEITATSREHARTIFFRNNPTFYVIGVAKITKQTLTDFYNKE